MSAREDSNIRKNLGNGRMAGKHHPSLLNPRYVPASTALEEARIAFASRQVVKLPKLLRPDAFHRTKAEVAMGTSIAIDRDFIMEEYDTPRRMAVLSGTMVTEHFPFIRSLYLRREIKALVEEVVGHEVFACEHDNEFAVVNYLRGPGQTHGWHIDDPDYALVIAIDVPRQGGGIFEMVPGFTPRHSLDAGELQRRLEVARTNGGLKTLCLEAGDAYILHASSTLHRVTELEGQDDRRSVINFAYCADKNQEYGQTADLLYG